MLYSPIYFGVRLWMWVCARIHVWGRALNVIQADWSDECWYLVRMCSSFDILHRTRFAVLSLSNPPNHRTVCNFKQQRPKIAYATKANHRMWIKPSYPYQKLQTTGYNQKPTHKAKKKESNVKTTKRHFFFSCNKNSKKFYLSCW